jgi:RecJ-like exonuclease
VRIENGRLVLGHKDCYCGDGTVAARLTCPACKGTGNGPRGGRGGCRKCYGSGTAYDQNVRTTCSRCNGAFKDFLTEDLCDHISDDDWNAFEFRVYHSNRQMTWGESYLGAGVYSCTDYGAHKALDDEVLIKEARRSGYVQATKITDRETMRVADHIGIFTAEQGYTVAPVFAK